MDRGQRTTSTAPSQHDAPSALLLTPGERLGWVFRDRNRYRRQFQEPVPTGPALTGPPPSHVPNWPWQVIGGAAAVMLVAFIFVHSLLLILGIFVAGMIGLAVWLGRGASRRRRSARSRSGIVSMRQDSGLMRAIEDWRGRKDAFERDEQARMDAIDEWGAAAPPWRPSRIDLVGGTWWGWEAALTVYGGSLLATRAPLTVIDLSGQSVADELVRLAQQAGVPVEVSRLPEDLEACDLLTGLDPSSLAEALVEAMHGDSPGRDRPERAEDARILSALCEALGADLSMGRLDAALRVLMGEPGRSPLLTDEERRCIADDLFGDEYRRQAHPRLRRLEAHIQPLERMGTRQDRRPSTALTCLLMEEGGRSPRDELLGDLIVQWLLRLLASSADQTRSLVLAGADELQRRHVERLSEICERRDVRLVLLFRHLRDASEETVGHGTVAFMRLGNHDEARRAADFIGRQHRFLVTQLTRTLGGSDTHSYGQTESVGDTVSTSGLDRTQGRSRTWGYTYTRAEGTSWSHADTTQRVYEYAVEPTTLQELPEYAMLLVERNPGGSVVQPVECNPDIITLRGVSMTSLPDLLVP
jgi:hypothetical protein